MSTLYHPRTFFILGIICVSIVVSLMIIISDAFDGSFWSTLGNTNDNAIKEQVSAGALPEDPLVTVVPKDVLAGYPRVLPTDPKRGATNPKIVLMEFGDFQCENCKAMDTVIRQILTEYPNEVQHVWKDFPLQSKHPFAETAAIAARCAADQQKFWNMYDVLFENQGLLGIGSLNELAAEAGLQTESFSACMSSGQNKPLVVQGYFVARSFDLTETPTFFINEHKLSGVQSYDSLKKIIDEEL